MPKMLVKYQDGHTEEKTTDDMKGFVPRVPGAARAEVERSRPPLEEVSGQEILEENETVDEEFVAHVATAEAPPAPPVEAPPAEEPLTSWAGPEPVTVVKCADDDPKFILCSNCQKPYGSMIVDPFTGKRKHKFAQQCLTAPFS